MLCERSTFIPEASELAQLKGKGPNADDFEAEDHSLSMTFNPQANVLEEPYENELPP